MDALDEGRLRFDEALQHLVDELEIIAGNRPLRLRLSCRSRDWRAALDRNDLARLYPAASAEPAIVVVEILPLDLTALRLLAAEKLGSSARVDDFVDAAMNRQVLPLAGHPLTLGLMLEAFAADGRLGTRRTEVFARAADLLVQERNFVHRDKGKILTTPEERLDNARHLAVLSVLSNRPAIFLPDADDPPPNALPGSLAVPDKQRLRETLDTALFTGGVPGSFRFLHPLLADFLAAQSLARRLDQGLRLPALQPLLCPGGEPPPTALRNLAAWLASFHRPFRQHLLPTDPATLIRGDVDTLPLEDRIALVESLAQRFEGRPFHREIDGFGDLGHKLPKDTLEALLDPARSGAVRDMGLDMVRSAQRTDLLDAVWAIAANPGEAQVVRKAALRAVCDVGQDIYAERLVALLDCPAGEDPDDELAGIVLDQLYPKYIQTSQALLALHTPRKENLIGMYRMFWSYRFLERIPSSDRGVALDFLTPQLSENGNQISRRDPRAELILSLLADQLELPGELEISLLAKWLRPLRYLGPLDHAGSEEPKKRIRALLSHRPDLKLGLLRHEFSNFPPGRDYGHWRDPLPRGSWQPEDFDALAELYCSEGLRADMRFNVFKRLLALHAQAAYRPVDRFEILDALAALNPAVNTLWQSEKVCKLDDERYRYALDDAQHNRSRQKDDIDFLARLTEQIDNLRHGRAPGIFHAVEALLEASHNSWFQAPELDKLAQATSPTIAAAAGEGFRAVWIHAPPEAAEWNHPENSASPWLIAAGYGLELVEAEVQIDWCQATDRQIEVAALLALRYALNELPAWFPRLFEAHAARLAPRVEDCLAQDAARASEDYASSTSKLVRAAQASSSLAALLLHWLRNRPPPANPHCLQALLTLALTQSGKPLAEYLPDYAHAAALENGDDGHALRRAALLLSAWWLTDWPAAQACLDSVWFADPRTQFSRIRAFVTAVYEVTEQKSRRHWPERAPFEASVAMAPWLHLEPLEPDERLGPRWIGPAEHFRDARVAILNAIAAGPAEAAHDALSSFLSQPRFEPEGLPIQPLLDDLARQTIDEHWQPAEPGDVLKVLAGSSRLVRSPAEFFLLVEDLCEQELREVLRSDASLVPVLWDGTKQAGRTPRDEKPLQAVLDNQLVLLLRSTPLLHVREPEAFDAKKEDCRLLGTLDSGEKSSLPVEIKQAMHADLDSAPLDQLVGKYMREARTGFGLYLVGWYGSDQPVGGRKHHGYTSPTALESALQARIDADLEGSEKRVRVIVLDCTV